MALHLTAPIPTGATITSVDSVAPFGSSELFDAIEAGDIAEVNRLFSPMDLEAVNDLGETPLTVAARVGNADIVTFFLEKGADIHATCLADATIYEVAISEEQPEIALMIINHEENAERKQQMLNRALTSAVYGNKPAAARLLLASGADYDILVSPIGLERVGPEPLIDDSIPLLNYAARLLSIDILRELIDAGARYTLDGTTVLKTDRMGKTILYYVQNPDTTLVCTRLLTVEYEPVQDDVLTFLQERFPFATP